MNITKNTLSKSERLTSKILITQLYNKGRHINDYPFKIVWLHNKEETTAGINVVFSVPKKKFKRAVDRNQIKRMLREVYRQNKHKCIEAVENQNANVSLFLVYLGKEIPQYKVVEDKIILLLNRLTKEITSN